MLYVCTPGPTWPLKATFIDKVHEAKAAEALPAYLDKNGRGQNGPLGVILEIIYTSKAKGECESRPCVCQRSMLDLTGKLERYSSDYDLSYVVDSSNWLV